MTVNRKRDCEKEISRWQKLIDRCNQNKILLIVYEKVGLLDMLNDAIVHCRQTESLEELEKLIRFYKGSMRRAVNAHLAVWASEIAVIHLALAWMGYWFIPTAIAFYYIFIVRMLN